MAEQSREPEILKSIIDNTEYNKTPQSRNEEILLSILNDTEYTKTPQSREEELLLALKEKIEGGGGASPVLIDKNITANGTYNAADDGADGYKKIVVDVTGKPALVPWSTGTDDEIVAMVNGYYSGALTIDEIKSVWSLGDCRSVNLSAMEAVYVSESHRAQTVEMMIIDFEHDNLVTPINGKEKALISINQKNVLSSGDVYTISDQQNTEKGYIERDGVSCTWVNCSRRSWCNEIYYQSIPIKIRNIIKECKKLSQGVAVNDYISLLSDAEINVSGENSEGYKYGYFGNYSEKEKRCKNPKYTGYISCSYWTRTFSITNRFYRIDASAGYSNMYQSTLYGIAPIFCL